MLGLNPNGDGDTKSQTQCGQSLVTNSRLMKGIKNIFFVVHKPAHSPPESHHPARNSTIEMLFGVESNVSKNIDVYEIAAHNHPLAESSNGRWFISGGGRSNHDAQVVQSSLS